MQSCNSCDIPPALKFNTTLSETETLIVEGYKTFAANIYEGQTLISNEFKGDIWKDSVAFEHNQTSLINLKNVSFLGISESISKQFSSEFSGFLGLAPYSANPQYKDYNFLYQMRALGYIDYLAFSLYTTLDEKERSILKIGGYDQDGMEENEHLTIIRTID